MKYVFMERLHRYVFDTIFVREQPNRLVDNIILFIYFKLTRKYNNWRFEFRIYLKRAIRYSSYDRVDDSLEADYILIQFQSKQLNH